MRRILLLLLLMAGAASMARAQALGTIFILDPDDAANYAEFTRREYRVALKQDGPKMAAQIQDNMVNTTSIVSTPQTGQTGSNWWKVEAPTWWKRMTTGVPGSSTTGPASQNQLLTNLFMGLDSYQRARATLRATALMYQSMKGLRFEINAWQMMKKLLVIEEGETILDADGTPFAKVPEGTVSISVVPRGKENWRSLVAMFNDSPFDDPNYKVKYIGPHKLSDISIDANEVGGNDAMAPKDAAVDLLQRMDAGARAAAEGLATVRMGVQQRKRDALNDAFSPRRLAANVKRLNNRVLSAYGSVLQLRALLEGRTVQDLQDEYAQLVEFSDDQARGAQAQAEMNAKFYQDMQNQAQNVVAEMELTDRLADLAKMEKEYEALFNLSSGVDGAIRDMDQLLKDNAAMINQLFPALVPYLGGIMLPIDTAAVVSGSANTADNDEKDPKSDLQAAFRDARVRALAIRFNWALWQELRASRRLAYIQEQVAAANHGLSGDKDADIAFRKSVEAQSERAAQLYRLRQANQAFDNWARGL